MERRTENIWEAKKKRMSSRREIWERNLGSEIQERGNVKLQNWGEIEEK